MPEPRSPALAPTVDWRADLTRPKHVWVYCTPETNLKDHPRPGLHLAWRKAERGGWESLTAYPGPWENLGGREPSLRLEWLYSTSVREHLRFKSHAPQRSDDQSVPFHLWVFGAEHDQPFRRGTRPGLFLAGPKQSRSGSRVLVAYPNAWDDFGSTIPALHVEWLEPKFVDERLIRFK